MSDVTAVVLSTGESYTARALASVASQTPPVADVVAVRDVAPFHAAVNHGAAQVQTPFFVQVDADMVLDAHCVASLRAAMTPELGLVVGLLRDALLERVVGVKLYRTECLRRFPLPDSVSPDTDVARALREGGWRTVGAIHPAARHTLGRHDPDYTPAYTYAKFLTTGARHRYRRNGGATRSLFRRLCESRHPVAPLAVAALAHGLFSGATADLLDASRCPRLPAVLAEPSPQTALRAQIESIGCDAGASLRDIFVAACHSGRASRDRGFDALRDQYQWLRAHWGVPAWVATVGFSHGLLADDDGDGERDYAILDPLLPGTEATST